MSFLNQRLRLSINPALIDKNQANDMSLFRDGWVNQALTPTELANWINDGVAYCCELSGSRRAANFVCSEVISVDIDGTRRIPDVFADPIAQRSLTIVYTTPNHTEAVHRFRLVFALPRPIQTAREMVAATRSLSLRLSGDRAATDAARIFYGSRGSNPQVFDRGIDQALLDELIAQGLDADQRDSISSRSGGPASTVSRLSIPAGLVVRKHTCEEVTFATLGARVSIHCPFHADTNASAFTVASSSGSAIGIRCSTCAQTFWPSSPPPYDFFDFDRRVAEAQKYFEDNKDMGDFHEFLTDQDNPVRRGLMSANVSISQTDYLSLPAKLPEGIIFIKSPKGTGKTERLKQILVGDKGSVLLIGHRVALIRQSCERLGLECYLDLAGHLTSERLGVCLDSLRRLRFKGSWLNKFRTIIIDESEQVLSHFLSDTIEPTARDEIFVDFKSLLQRAERVIALDADLGWLSFETISKLAQRPKDEQIRPSHVFINDRPKDSSIEVFDSFHHLVGLLMECLSDGKRVFVTSNSKGQIESLYEAIDKEFGEGLHAIQITSDTKDRDDVKAFIMNPGELALRYRAILTSPSLGTGIDITFPEQQQHVDVVFGFFETNITTHFDFDQQLARVRHPGSVKVWISPRRYRFDTSVEVIKGDIQLHGLYKSVLKGYDDDGRPVYHTDDPLIDMAALAVSQQRASKNNLRANFIELKKRQGVRIDFVAEDDSIGSRGIAADMISRNLAKAKRVANLMGATTLREQEYEDIEGRTQENQDVSEHERWCFTRTAIEKFYRESLTEALIVADNKGALRTQVSRFERFVDFLENEETRSRMGITSDLANMESFGLKTRFLRDERIVSRLLRNLFRATPVFVEDSFILQKEFSLHSLSAFMAECRKHKPVIENLLELEVAKTPRSAVKQLNAILNVVGLRAINNGKTKSATKGKTVYKYVLCADSLKQMQEIIERRRRQPGWTWLNQHYGWRPADDGE